MKHVLELEVTCDGRRVGRLAQGERGKIFFQYDHAWLEQGFSLAPGMMAFDASAQPARAPLFEQLHGVFNDSLPDGWGMLLMDRVFRAKVGWARGEITPMDRLAYLGARGMGALEYRPATWPELPEDEVDLAALAADAHAQLAGSESEVLTQLRILGGSPGGARPKVTIARSTGKGDDKECRSGFADLPKGYAHWLVKFRSLNDAIDMGRVERAYADMAKTAGIMMEKTDLIEAKVGGKSEAFFATRRFDRIGANKRAVLSLAGYLYADHRAPSVDYDQLLAATMKITQDFAEVRHAFRQAVFNVLAHNKDDHAKNFAFVFDVPDRRWHLSPAYDLTFSHGMAGEHISSVAGKGNPARKDLLQLAHDHAIIDANVIIDEVRSAIASWRKRAKRWGVYEGTSNEVEKAMREIDRRF